MAGSRQVAAYQLVRAPVERAPAPVLDEAQRAVVEHPGGPLLVLAGPGTGKTTTLVETMVDRIERGADPAKALVLTFSRRAAGELRSRIVGRLGRTVREPLARTFHSYAFGVLRRAAGPGQTPRLLTGPEQDLVVREMLAGDVADGAAYWPEDLRAALLTRGFAEELRDLLLRATERGIGPAELRRHGRARKRSDWLAAADFYQQYLEVTALSDSTAYDPAELIGAALEAFQRDPALLARERAARRRIYVDEYQDVDPAQEALLRVISAGAEELVVVGDPDQSIYAFRGADPNCLRRFPDVFAPALPGGGVGEVPVLALTGSRRSGTTLLAASRRVAERLPAPPRGGDHRALVPAAGLPPGRLRVALLRTPSEEAAYVAHQLREAHLKRGVPWREMAVLVRSTAYHLPVLRRALITAGVPVAVAFDDLPLVDTAGAAPFLLALRVALQPQALTENTAVELLGGPIGGADALALRRLRQHLRRIELAAGGRRPSGPLLVEALEDPKMLATLPPTAAAPALRVASVLAEAREAAGTPIPAPPGVTRETDWLGGPGPEAGGTAEMVLWAIWEASGLAAVWHRESLRGGPAGAAADRDLDAVVALFDTAAKFVDRLPRAGALAFLEHLSAQEIPGDTLAAQAPTGDAVRVLTAHASKGLQWQVVCVAGVQEGSWPDLRRRGTLLGVEAMIDADAGIADIEATSAPLLAEERRLFYVAVTRASREVVVTATSGEEEQPSRFLDELDPLPKGVLERPISPVPRTLALPALVAELRAVVCDPTTPEVRRRAAARELARLAAADVPGADPAEWWGLAGMSDPRPLRDPGEPVQVKPSSVEKFLGCPLRWLLESSGGTKIASAAQSMGTIIHELAELAADPRLADEAELTSRLDEALSQLDLGGPWATRQSTEKARKMLAKFLTWLGGSRDRWRLIGVELPFEVKVGDRARLTGQVDRLERDGAGRLVVIDLKTGTTPVTDVAMHPQLGCYQLAVAEGGLVDPDVEVGTAEPGGAALVQIGTSAASASVREQLPLAEAEDPEWARQMVEGVAEGMAGEDFIGRASPMCRNCPVRSSCPVHDEGRQVTE